jgi:hypothetical protein
MIARIIQATHAIINISTHKTSRHRLLPFIISGSSFSDSPYLSLLSAFVSVSAIQDFGSGWNFFAGRDI